MRLAFMVCAVVAGIALGGTVHARGLRVNDEHCGYSTDYDVSITSAGVGFSRDEGRPRQVFLHDGYLRVDGGDVAVSADDAARLRQYEQQMRALMPEVAGIAREGVNIGFAAMRAVMMTFAENDGERREMVDRLDRNHRDALARIDDTLGKGEWKQRTMDSVIERSIQGSLGDLAGKVAGAAVTATLSGDEGKVAALEARADSLEASIDREIDARADQLDRRAQALCPRLGSLEQLQRQLQLRLADGSRLQLLTYQDKDNKKLVTATERSRAD